MVLILKKTDDIPQKRPSPMQDLENEEINTEPHIGFPARGPRILKDTLDCMDTWIKNCIQNHSHCTRHKTVHKTMQYMERLPSRLLGVNPKQGNDFVTIRNTSDMDASTKYMTLSHCWYVVVSLDQVFRNSFCLQPVRLVCRQAQIALLEVIKLTTALGGLICQPDCY